MYPLPVRFEGNWDKPVPEIAGLLVCLKTEMDEAMRDAEKQGQFFIATRGTPKSGKQGRIDTGDMLESFSSAVATGNTKVTGFLGWLDEQPYYAEWQEGGSETIPAMWALRDSAKNAWDQLLEGVDRCTADWARRRLG